MKTEDFGKLEVGDVIRNRATGDGFIVLYKHYHDGTATYTVGRFISATNPIEWEKVR